MQEYPHHYRVSASGGREGSVSVSGAELPTLETNPPPEFNGPSGYWSPETLLVAAVADCFILSFRAVARASKLEWKSLSCEVEGILEKEDRITRFTRFILKPSLTLSSDDDRRKAERCLEKAEQNCLITSSLNSEKELVIDIEIAQ
ncbi:peroxiredoxin, SACOL1771 subfamily [Modicisalibacter ilicicola DSM 19980]|uniref:Peroxiredoxin, SACOL1771 subfamily n=1 Tax=Modicisalibacter ilicicola DSM 19980 TaxID=1121942 RepID=A0A1M4SGP9_9GAMM|nr:OsmC family protein [Halomonas ilicicola]SHE31328.1 peroxiredoxin, SACOL1771 subfamily [Halomonas ilicicola DSM 19980]